MTDLDALFDKYGSDKGSRCHKYGSIYEFLLKGYRTIPCRILEIGVADGASIMAMLEYLPKSKIIGLDVNPRFFCPDFLSDRVKILTGSQFDGSALDLVKSCGTYDLIIDDGSHISGHQQYCFENLFKSIPAGGTYVIEDTHVSYREEYQLDGYIPTMEYFKSKASSHAIGDASGKPWIIFANELVAIRKLES